MITKRDYNRIEITIIHHIEVTKMSKGEKKFQKNITRYLNHFGFGPPIIGSMSVNKRGEPFLTIIILILKIFIFDYIINHLP